MVSQTVLSCEELNVKGQKCLTVSPSKSPRTESSNPISWLDKKTDFVPNTVYKSWPNLPRIFLTNARSINNKKPNLSELIKTDKDIQKCDILFFTETWLKEGYDDFKEEGYTQMLRADRDKDKTGKLRGGGLAALIKDGSGIRVEQQESVSDPNYELVPFLCYPHGHPENTPPLIFILVYIAGKDFEYANEKMTEYYNKVQQWSKGGPIFLLGDFNHCDFSHLKVSLRRNARSVEQYVTCPTKEEKILDRCYGNIPKFFKYKSKCKHPLRSKNKQSDHKIIILSQENEKCKHTETAVGQR